MAVAEMVGVAVGDVDARGSVCSWSMRGGNKVLCRSSGGAQECQAISLTLNQSLNTIHVHVGDGARRPLLLAAATNAPAEGAAQPGWPSPSSSSTAPHLRHVVGKQVRAIETQVRLAHPIHIPGRTP